MRVHVASNSANNRSRMRGVATRGNTIAFGSFALQAQECGWITRQIEASRRAMTRYTKREERSGSGSSRQARHHAGRRNPDGFR